jgi:hypothetical protein
MELQLVKRIDEKHKQSGGREVIHIGGRIITADRE